MGEVGGRAWRHQPPVSPLRGEAPVQAAPDQAGQAGARAGDARRRLVRCRCRLAGQARQGPPHGLEPATAARTAASPPGWGDDHPSQAEGQLALGFVEIDEERQEAWEYGVLVTSLETEVLTIAQFYRDRGDCENSFDELKNH